MAPISPIASVGSYTAQQEYKEEAPKKLVFEPKRERAKEDGKGNNIDIIA
jgi:hypothetical protein